MTPASTEFKHQQRMWNNRLRQHCLADAQSVKHVERIGPKLNAIADDAELRCLFE